MLRRLLAALAGPSRPCAHCGLPFRSPADDALCAECQDDLAPRAADPIVRDLLLLHED